MIKSWSKLKLLIILPLTGIALSFSAALAHADDLVPAISVTGLPAGQVLNVFYANGRPALISQTGSTPVIHSVYLAATPLHIASNGNENLPETSVPRDLGFHFANYAILVVGSTATPTYFQNSDGSVPSYPGKKQPTKFSAATNVRYIHFSDYPAGTPISFDFSAPLK